jgi:hypothetical protein
LKKIQKYLWGLSLKIVLGISMAWLCLAMACVMGQAFLRVHWLERESLVFVSCFLAYFLVHFLLYQPILSHVMAHELTHALAALLMGGKVTSIHASTTGGTTVTNKSHLFISLAPYVFPFYTAIALLLFAIAAPAFRIWILGLIGFTYAFHIALTAYSLSHHQPDLKEGGVAFSLIFIFTGNMIVLMLLFAFLWPQALSVPQAFSETLRWAWTLAQTAFHLLKPHLSRPEDPHP